MAYHGGGGGPDQWGGGSAPPYGGGPPPQPPYGGHAPPAGGYGGGPPPGGAPPYGPPGGGYGHAPPAYGGGAPGAYGQGDGGYGAPGAYGQGDGGYVAPPYNPHGGYGGPPSPAYGGAPQGYPPPGGYPPPAGGAPSGYPPPGGYPPPSSSAPGGYPAPGRYPPPGGGAPGSYPPAAGGYPPAAYPHEQLASGGGGDAQRFLGHGASHHVTGHAPAASARGRPVAAGAHIFPHPETFSVKEKVLSASGDSFNIKDASGRLRYLVDGTTFTMRQRKRLLGPAKEPLLGMSQERMSLRSRMVISDSTGRPAVTLRKRGFVSGMGNSTVYAWWGSDPDAASPFLEVKGDVFKKSYTITEVGSGAQVGTVKRHALSFKNFVTDKDDFTLTVQPGYDCALMVMLVVALDEMYTDDN